MHWKKLEWNTWTFLNSCFVHVIFSAQWCTAQHAKLFVPPQVEVTFKMKLSQMETKNAKKRSQTTAMKIHVDSNLRNICSNQFWSPSNSEVSWTKTCFLYIVILTKKLAVTTVFILDILAFKEKLMYFAWDTQLWTIGWLSYVMSLEE